MRKIYFFLLAFACGISVCSAEAVSLFENTGDALTARKVSAMSLSEISEAVNGIRPEAAPRAASSVITSPQGTKTDYIQSGNRRTLMWGLIPVEEQYDDVVTDIVYGPDGKVYVKNMVSGYPTGTYVEGTLADGVATFTFPQAVASEGGSTFYIYRMDLKADPFSGDEGTYVVSQDQTVTFAVGEDKKWTMDKSGGRWIVGLTDSKGNWLEFGDYDVVYELNTYELLQAPADLKTETWQLVSNYTGHDVTVGFYGDEVYIRGVSTKCPDAWIKAKVEGDKIVYTDVQYAGTVAEHSALAFIMPGLRTLSPNGRYAYAITEQTVFDYDAANHVMSTSQAILVNTNTETLQYMEFYAEPTIRPEAAEHSYVPQNIIPAYYMPYTVENGAGGYQFYIPNLSIDNYILDKSKMFWELYVNGELYTFQPGLYAGLPEATTIVPYDTQYAGLFNGGIPLHELHFFMDNVKTLGVVSYYVDGDKKYSSQLVVFNADPSSIEDVMAGESDAAEEYFDLLGRRVENPAPGTLCIVRKGSEVTKRIVR